MTSENEHGTQFGWVEAGGLAAAFLGGFGTQGALDGVVGYWPRMLLALLIAAIACMTYWKLVRLIRRRA